MQNFMIDLDHILSSNKGLCARVQEQKRYIASNYESQSQRIEQVHANAVKLMDQQRQLARKQIYEQYQCNARVLSGVERQVRQNQKEAEHIQSDVHSNLDDIHCNLEQQPLQQILQKYRSRFAAIERQIS